MFKACILACTFLMGLTMSPHNTGTQWIMPSQLWSLEQAQTNLLEADEFYTETLPQMLGEDFHPKGEYKTPFFALPPHFHPFSNDPLVSSVWELCTGTLAQLKVGQYETQSPCLASKITEEFKGNQIHYHVTLKDDIYWNPIDIDRLNLKESQLSDCEKIPVTSKDFKLYVDMIKNPHVDMSKAVSLRSVYEELKEVRVIDQKNFVVVWEFKSAPLYTAKLLTGQLKPIPAHIYLYWPNGKPMIQEGEDVANHYAYAKHFCNHWARFTIVSCGPWIFNTFNQKELILERNPHYHNRYAALMEKMIFIFKPNTTSAWQSFKGGNVTSCYLTPFQLKDYDEFMSRYLLSDSNFGVKKLEFFSKIYYFIGWNNQSPLFEAEKVRKAFTLAINREKILEHFLQNKGSPITGPFMPGSMAYDSSVQPLPYDPELAIKLLEEEGWYTNELFGIRQKNVGNKKYLLRVHLSYFIQNELAQSICQYIANNLKKIGAECILQGLDYTEFMDRYKIKNFDAVFMGWVMTAPPENLWPSWHSSEADKVASSNIVGFKDKEVDRLIEELKYCSDLEKRKELYHRAHQRIHALQPYTFLYVPKQILVYRKELQNVFIPKNNPELISEATIEEPCPKIFYMD